MANYGCMYVLFIRTLFAGPLSKGLLICHHNIIGLMTPRDENTEVFLTIL